MIDADFCTNDIAFTPAVKSVQARKGSRETYQRMADIRPWQNVVTPDLAAFIAEQTSVFLATVNGQGQPYIQHRGGPPGFLAVVDDHTLGFVDFSGNRQFITQGNLSENPHAHLFLIDYTRAARIKIWGTARIVENDADLTAKLWPAGYRARAEQVLLFSITAWDANCPQHIPRRIDAADVAAMLASRDQRISELEAALAAQS